ncbi:MAG: hypothetical protein ACLRSW_09415 [Christensenellaceae bacterium]
MSGDAVYAINEAEDESGVLLGYCIPDTVSTWFDGWVSKGANVEVATIYQLSSMPKRRQKHVLYRLYQLYRRKRGIRLSQRHHEAEEGDMVAPSSMIWSYFFEILTVKGDLSWEQRSRQLFAQYPDADHETLCRHASFEATQTAGK